MMSAEEPVIPYAKLPNEAKFPQELKFTPETAYWIRVGFDQQGLLYYLRYNGDIVAIPAVNVEEKKQDAVVERKVNLTLEKEIEELRLQILNLDSTLEKLESSSDQKVTEKKEAAEKELARFHLLLEEKQIEAKKAIGKLSQSQVSAISARVTAVYDRHGNPYPKFASTSEAKSSPTGSGAGSGGSLHKTGAGILGIGLDNLAGGLWRGGYKRVLMLGKEPTLEDMKTDTLVMLLEDEQLTAFWLKEGKLQNHSFPADSIPEIVKMLPKQGEASENRELITKIKSKYDCWDPFIGEIRTRATANMKIQRNPVFMIFFKSNLPTAQDAIGHSQVYVRELPWTFFSKFLDALYVQFYQDNMSRADFEKEISFAISGPIALHLNYEKKWEREAREWFENYFSKLLLSSSDELDNLIEALFDPSFKSENHPLQLIAFQLAITHHRDDIVLKLIYKGLNPGIMKMGLLQAIETGNEHIFQSLIELKIHLTPQEIKAEYAQGNDIFHAAVRTGNFPIIHQLLHWMGDEFKLPQENKQQLLLNAIEYKNMNAIKIALSLGANPKDSKIIDAAMNSGDLKIINIFGEFGIDDKRISEIKNYRDELLHTLKSCQESKIFNSEFAEDFKRFELQLSSGYFPKTRNIPEIAIANHLSLANQKRFFETIPKLLISQLIAELQAHKKYSISIFKKDHPPEIKALFALQHQPYGIDGYLEKLTLLSKQMPHDQKLIMDKYILKLQDLSIAALSSLADSLDVSRFSDKFKKRR